MTPKIDKIICNLKKYNQSHIIKYLYNQQGDLNESLVTKNHYAILILLELNRYQFALFQR